MAVLLNDRQRGELLAVWRARRLSRLELHRQVGVRPNTVGMDVAHLIKVGILRESPGRAKGRGRPRVPVEIDPDRRDVLGLAVLPGAVEMVRLNLLGQPLAEEVYAQRRDISGVKLVAAARDLLKELLHKPTLAVGLSTAGLIDLEHHRLLLSSVLPASAAVSLEPIYKAAGATPVVLENDMHALAARWLLTRGLDVTQDVLLVYFEEGQLGAALLVNGTPNRGCLSGANELGHTRLAVPTARCYCGHTGCLERICSTEFLRRHDPACAPLTELAAAYTGGDGAFAQVLGLLGMGISNVVNFTRVHRLVLVSSLLQNQIFAKTLEQAIRSELLQGLAERVRIEVWESPVARAAETAGWLALAGVYCNGWH